LGHWKTKEIWSFVTGVALSVVNPCSFSHTSTSSRRILPTGRSIEQDGYYYGRGTTDDKDEAAIHIANLIRLKREGFQPDRDIIVALTADEEGGSDNGVVWLLENHRELIDAEYALNEGGSAVIKDGKHIANGVQASEKVYQTFTLEVTNPGGHSSLPVKDNAIYHLADALVRRLRFPRRT